MSDLTTLKLACLAGGNIYLLGDVGHIGGAEHHGAVGIGLTEPSVEGYKRLISQSSVNVITDTQHVNMFEEACRQLRRSDVTCLVFGVSGIGMENPNHIPVAQVTDTVELEHAIEDGSPLICVSTINLLQEAKRLAPGMLVFLNAGSIETVRTGALLGADGHIFNSFFPKEEQVTATLEARLSANENFGKKDGETLIGIMGLQGDYLLQKKEIDALNLPNARAVLVHSVEELAQVDALVLPGGWSNLQSRYLDFDDGRLGKAVRAFAREKPVLAVCAGMILAGSEKGKDCEGRTLLGLIEGKIDNNMLNGSAPIIIRRDGRMVTEDAVFSDGPVISNLCDGAEVLARVGGNEGPVIIARDGNVTVSGTHANGIHKLFMDEVMRTRGHAAQTGATPKGSEREP